MMPATEERLTIEPPPRLLHRPHRLAAAEKRALDIDRVDLAPVGERRRLDIAEDADAGAVDQDVEAAERRPSTASTTSRQRASSVTSWASTRSASGPSVFEARFVAIGRGDFRALGVEQRRRRPADAGRRAGDERDLAGETPALLRPDRPPPLAELKRLSDARGSRRTSAPCEARRRCGSSRR